jgi:O-acetyl-ADP-ribose deacetylase (regulator of RNase III)
MSIAVPAFGTGVLSFPADVAAKNILQKIDSFSAKNPRASVRLVRITVYDQDVATADVSIIVLRWTQISDRLTLLLR